MAKWLRFDNMNLCLPTVAQGNDSSKYEWIVKIKKDYNYV